MDADSRIIPFPFTECPMLLPGDGAVHSRATEVVASIFCVGTSMGFDLVQNAPRSCHFGGLAPVAHGLPKMLVSNADGGVELQ